MIGRWWGDSSVDGGGRFIDRRWEGALVSGGRSKEGSLVNGGRSKEASLVNGGMVQGKMIGGLGGQ